MQIFILYCVQCELIVSPTIFHRIYLVTLISHVRLEFLSRTRCIEACVRYASATLRGSY